MLRLRVSSAPEGVCVFGEVDKLLAVSDFQGSGGSTLLNTLVTKLFEGRRFEILERSRLARILDELALSQSGVVNATTAAKVGKGGRRAHLW